MNLLGKVWLKLKIETVFLLEQKLGWKESADRFSIPKYLARKYLPSNPVIIDCGANHGTDSVEFARIFPRAAIHSFEPVPGVFPSLQKSTQKYKNIYCYELALSSVTGKSKMYISSGSSDGSSSLQAPKSHLEDHPTVFFENAIDVSTSTLDDWAAGNNITHVDFLWLDMQGHEFEMLKASKKILNTVKAIHTEVSVKETYDKVTLYPEVKQWLESRGFEVVKEAIPPGADMGNVLFARKQPS